VRETLYQFEEPFVVDHSKFAKAFGADPTPHEVAIERTLEFYALTASNDTIDDFREGHDRAYDRGAELGVVTEETARRLKQLYRENRAAAYYRDTVAATQQADAMFNLAVVTHDYIKEFAQCSHECRCRR